MSRADVRGWVAVALVALAAAVAQSFGRFTYSVLLPAVRDDLGISNALAGLLGTVNVGAYLLGTLLVVRATARLRLMTLMRVGLGLSLSGLALAAVAPGGPVLAAALVLMGLGGAAIWIPSPALASSAVPPTRRGLAVGITGAGIGLGIVSAGQLATALRGRFGDAAWQDVYRVETAVAVVVALVIVLLLRPRDDPRPNRTASGLAVLRTMDGWAALTGSYAAFGFGYLLAFTYLTARLEDDAGFTEAAASSVFALVGLAGIGGGILFGAVTDRIGPRRTLVGGFVALSASMLAVLTGDDVVVRLGAVVLGATFSGIPAVIAAYIVEASDADTYGPRYAMATLAFGVAQVSSPQVGGLIADATGGFLVVFVVAAATGLAGAATSWALPRTPRARPRSQPANR